MDGVVGDSALALLDAMAATVHTVLLSFWESSLSSLLLLLLLELLLLLLLSLLLLRLADVAGSGAVTAVADAVDAGAEAAVEMAGAFALVIERPRATGPVADGEGLARGLGGALARVVAALARARG